MVDQLKNNTPSLVEIGIDKEPAAPVSAEPSLRKSRQLLALNPKSLVKLAGDLRPLRKPQQLGMLDMLRDPSYKAPEPREVADITVDEEYVAVLALARGKYSRNSLKHPGDASIALVGFPKMVARPKWERGRSGTIDNLNEVKSTLREASELVRSLRLGAAGVYNSWLNDPERNMSLEGLPAFHNWVRNEYPEASNEEVLGILVRDPQTMRRRFPIVDRTAGFLPVPEGELVKDGPVIEIPLDAFHSSKVGHDKIVAGLWVEKATESATHRSGAAAARLAGEGHELPGVGEVPYGLSRPERIPRLISFTGREQELAGHFANVDDQGERVLASSKSIAVRMFPDKGGDGESQTRVARMRADVIRKIERPREQWGPDIVDFVTGLIRGGKFKTVEEILEAMKRNAPRKQSAIRPALVVSGPQAPVSEIDIPNPREVPVQASSLEPAAVKNAELSDAEILKRLRASYTGEEIAYVGRVIQVDAEINDFKYSEIGEVSRAMGIPESQLSKSADRLVNFLGLEVRREEQGREASEAAVLLFDWVRRYDTRFTLLTNKEVAALIDMQLGMSEVEAIAAQRKAAGPQAVQESVPVLVDEIAGTAAVAGEAVEVSEGPGTNSRAERSPKRIVLTPKQRATLEPFFENSESGKGITLAAVAEVAYADELSTIGNEDYRQRKVAAAMATISLNRTNFIERMSALLEDPANMDQSFRDFLDDAKRNSGLGSDREVVEFLQSTKTYKPRTR